MHHDNIPQSYWITCIARFSCGKQASAQHFHDLPLSADADVAGRLVRH